MKLRILALSFLLIAPLSFAFSAEAAETHIRCKVGATSKLIEKGEQVTIAWGSINSIITYGPGGATTTASGRMQVAPKETTIYKFKFVGIGGNEKCGIRIRVKGDEPQD